MNTTALEEFLRIHFENNSQGLSVVHYFMQQNRNLTSTITSGNDDTFGDFLLVFAYGVLIAISLFGNSIVCYVILKNKRMYTVTNFFIANMALSDLLLTVFNVPFNIARHLLHNWPFGDALCHLVNFSLMVSVYVSTFTLTAIALDRQCVLLYPLRPRMSKLMGGVVLVIIWAIAIFLSLPYGIYNKVQTVSLLIETAERCSPDYPEPEEVYKKYLSLVTIILQYIVPLCIIAVAYGRIVRKLWLRVQLGAVTQRQQVTQARAKRKSIKLLVTVVVVFALCWMPLNLYHLLTNFHPDVQSFRFDSTTFFVLHWIAISSSCYNPFVYCWLNETFRAEVKACFKRCVRNRKVHPGVDVDGILLRHDVFRRTKTITTVIRSSTFTSYAPHSSSENRNTYPFYIREESPLVDNTTASTEFTNISVED